MMSPFNMLSLLLLQISVFASKKPNFILVYVDNQDLLLGSNAQAFLPILNSHIIDEGIEIQYGFTNTPICCPSRAELLTGRYFHNLGPPFPPNGTCMHIDPYGPIFDSNTLFQIMYNNGYHTGAFGKIVNDMPFWCDKSSVPVINGLSRIYIPCEYLNYYGHNYFSKYENGTYEYLYQNESYQSIDLYETSQIGNATLDWIDQLYHNDSDANFFAIWGCHAPHYPATPAFWYRDRFNDTETYKAPRTPNFNQHYPNRHWLVENEPQLDEQEIYYMDQLYRDRLRAMLSVDDFIYALDETLDRWDIKDNTYVIFLSDNGYHMGQWRIPCDFRNIYETDIRVPWWIRGPGIKAKSSMKQIVSNVDIAPTIYDLAGIQIDRETEAVDGKNFTKFLFEQTEKHDGSDWRDMLLLEYIWHDNKTFHDYAIWFPNETDYNYNKKPPLTNDLGEKSWTDNSYMSSFRAIRIQNDTFNITYGEYVDPDWTVESMANPIFYELYNNTADPWQMNNIYNETSVELKQYLHQTVAWYGSCKSITCP
eukprot:451260_1